MSDLTNEPTPPTSDTLITDAHSTRILVVDDKPGNLIAMEAILEPLGFSVVTASSGDEALRHLLFGDFAVILMDVQMPNLDGLETARIIKARERSRHIPIIFVTALSREASYVMSGYESGGVDYLMKPLEPAILRSKVAVFAELFQRGEQLKEQTRELTLRRHTEQEARRHAAFSEELLAIVGHDVRSPVSTVLMTSQLLVQSGRLEGDTAKAVDRISRSGKRIASLVNLLVDFTQARLGGGLPVTRKPTDLNRLVCEVVDEFRGAHPGREFECTTDGRHTIEIDPDRMAQVVTNLLDNAVKHGGEGTILVRTWRHESGEVRLEVRNPGEPIPKEILSEIFQPYRRGPDPSRERGLGLGLYIVREIARAHGGDVEARSDQLGSRFMVRLPEVKVSDCADEQPAGQMCL